MANEMSTQLRRHVRALIRDGMTVLAVTCLALVCVSFVVREGRRESWTVWLWMASAQALTAVLFLWKGHPNAPHCECYGGSWPDEEAEHGE